MLNSLTDRIKEDRVAVCKGVGIAEPGPENILGIGPSFVICMSPAYARLDVGLKLFRPDAKHMPMPNLGSEHQLCIC